eukprot:m.281928 g.281928  ORF g.281928 m.281928 type:complete len:579 (-) comp16181_c0_seq5:74-1810(-)
MVAVGDGPQRVVAPAGPGNRAQPPDGVLDKGKSRRNPRHSVPLHEVQQLLGGGTARLGDPVAQRHWGGVRPRPGHVTVLGRLAQALHCSEYPGSYGGDWSPSCRALYQTKYGAPMPTDHTTLTVQGVSYPLSTSRNVLQLMSDVTEAYFAELVAAIAAATSGSGRLHFPGGTLPSAAPDAAAALVSAYVVPAPDNSGRLYESTALLRTGGCDVAKSEFVSGTRVAKCPALHAPLPCYAQGGVVQFPPDVLSSFGWAMMRDGANGRPPHIWIPLSLASNATSNQSICTTVAVRGYGGIANPDHAESNIPDRALFEPTYQLSASLDQLPADLAVASHTAVLFSESSRDALMRGPLANGTFDVSDAWTSLLLPTVGAWEALLRAGVAAGICNDGQILAPDGGVSILVQRWPVLLAPTSGLTSAVESGLTAYRNAGGVLIRVPNTGWVTERGPAEASVIAAVNASAPGLGPIQATHPGDGVVHAVLQTSAADPNTRVVFVLNDFTTCAPVRGSAAPPTAPPIDGISLDLAAPAGRKLVRATDLMTGVELEIEPLPQPVGGRDWRVLVGTLRQQAVVVATFDI